MKPTSFTLDKWIYELLQEERFAQFTTREMRDAYALRLEGVSYPLSDVRRYVYEQIRRMLKSGWLVKANESRKRGQVYHRLPMPEHLQLKLIDNGFKTSLKPGQQAAQAPPEHAQSSMPSTAEVDAYQRLNEILERIRLDFLTSTGETERYKQLVDEMPHLLDHVKREYREVKDRSFRLLGHHRAVEKALSKLPSL
ncbi:MULTISPECIES: hypothetical protein [Halomonadaceae]|uniref:Uncharacterized protein n=1 Tax=Modicisalibacter ilicicola DSM 19980 TaxID=1121942 RepID=A0A1M5CWJ3_9GAMM|nr:MULTISPECIES: hypothetical protein [Halomonas]SHF59113.1 hypothetical protein SAMN02745148_03051 [Halomonas ilicicola DSM 19980]